MIFHQGRLPSASYQFMYEAQPLEIVKIFCYLGFWLTVQLSFTRHLESVIAKARARIGLLFARLPLSHLPLHLAIKVFQVFVAPLFHYGLGLWLSSVSNAALQSLDSVWSKYLKRYLGLPPFTNNAMVMFITNSQPLSESLRCLAPHRTGGLTFPESLSGMQLSFLINNDLDVERYNPVPLIPTAFWSTRIIENIPANAFYRKRLMREVFDLDHKDICKNIKFHVHSVGERGAGCPRGKLSQCHF